MDILAKEFNEFLKIKKVGNSHKSKNDSSVDITSWENKKKKGSRKKHSMKSSIEAIICSDDDSNGDERGHFDEGDANLCFMARKDDEPNRHWDQISPGGSPLNRPLLWPPKPRCGLLSCLLYVSGVGACRLGKTIGQFGEVKARPGSFQVEIGVVFVLEWFKTAGSGRIKVLNAWSVGVAVPKSETVLNFFPLVNLEPGSDLDLV
ncbi:hypothetical protein RJ639_030839 [Escallonia herrerae]|uniref:Uncharacterized protein n=1 Tax=Escallonia herrerae TaxID=1293975 RepID=A0AA88X9V3_9ASTE|nr:hypothetical protein RJ639_030839 [Escallonia herrerae]